jgi:hypothetical protein
MPAQDRKAMKGGLPQVPPREDAPFATALYVGMAMPSW